MSLKIEVTDRVPTYPGRVVMTPVNGQANTYDLRRADQPISEGTPINKALLDQKAYTLTESVTVYVSKSGSDSTGDGSSAKPFLTVQKAIDSIPKNLGSYHAQIDIGAGTYDERALIDGFVGGRITLGVAGRSVILRGVTIMSSSAVRLAISNITYHANYAGTLLYLAYGSNVTLISPLSLNAANTLNYGIALEHGSFLNAGAVSVNVDNCGRAAVLSTLGSVAVFYGVTGSGNTTHGLAATLGGTITYASRTITGGTGDYANNGGRIFTGGA